MVTDVSAAHTSEGAEPDETGSGIGWLPARWVTILDRIEHRDATIGLRFWCPPLWLEVTMTGPDSDLWPAVTGEVTAWDWQSGEPCCEVTELAATADDDVLLGVVSRYTIENLVLNAVHEIGEWLRFDGQRLFPAHGPDRRDTQGNGAVAIHFHFGTVRAQPGDQPAASADDVEGADRSPMRCLAEAVSPARFTYLPDVTISFDERGPVVRRWPGGEPWRATWSSATIGSARSGHADLLGLVARDVHGALVSFEANRICRAFHIDGVRPWRIADEVTHDVPGADPPAIDDRTRVLALSIDYGDAPNGSRTTVEPSDRRLDRRAPVNAPPGR